MLNRKFILFHLLYLSLFLSVLGCNREKTASVAGQVTPTDMPDQEGWNSTVTSTKEGRIEAILKYGHMMRYSEKKLAKFDEGIKVDFYQADGKHSSLLTAERGELNESNNDVVGMGNVVVISDTGVTLYTQRLAYRQATGKIFTDEEIMLTTTDGDTLYGTGFESEPGLEHYVIKKAHGKAHSGADLSTERWKRKEPEQADSLAVEPDSLKMQTSDSLVRRAGKDSLR